MKDTHTLFDKDRLDLSSNQWAQRKKLYRRNGLKSGDWFTIMPNNLKLKHMRQGMVIQNTKHENIIYRVTRIDASVRKGFNAGRPCILVVETKDIGKEKVKVKELIDLSQFRLVIQ